MPASFRLALGLAAAIVCAAPPALAAREACTIAALEGARAEAAADVDGTAAAARFRERIAACLPDHADACLEALGYDMPGYPEAEPRLAALAPAVRDAVLETLAACAEAAPWSSAGAISYRIGQANLFLHAGPLRALPCAERSAGASLVVPDGRCLSIEPPPGDAAACPALVVHEPDGSTRPLDLPADAWLRDADLCCAAADLRATEAGDVRIAPLDNPPEGCTSGRRSRVVEEIYRLDGARLVPVSRVAIGVW